MRVVVRHGAIAILAAALPACAWLGGSEPPAPAEPARVRVELFGGFPAERPPIAEGRVALLVESTDDMGDPSEAGTPLVRAARAAALRFANALPETTELSLVVVGNDWEATCDAPASHYAGDRDDLARRVSRLRARGRGSLAAALDDLASPEEGGFSRIVAITSLRDTCGGDLCRAIAALPARGVRLDLVVLGDAKVPDCVERATIAGVEESTLPWRTDSRRPFHIESTGPDPAVLVCGETGGLPVVVAPGRASVVLELDPPLRIQRNFLAGTRWVLQVIDFPSLDPPERQWRWQADARPRGQAAVSSPEDEDLEGLEDAEAVPAAPAEDDAPPEEAP